MTEAFGRDPSFDVGRGWKGNTVIATQKEPKQWNCLVGTAADGEELQVVQMFLRYKPKPKVRQGTSKGAQQVTRDS
jgi:hypothetical protein